MRRESKGCVERNRLGMMCRVNMLCCLRGLRFEGDYGGLEGWV